MKAVVCRWRAGSRMGSVCFDKKNKKQKADRRRTCAVVRSVYQRLSVSGGFRKFVHALQEKRGNYKPPRVHLIPAGF